MKPVMKVLIVVAVVIVMVMILKQMSGGEGYQRQSFLDQEFETVPAQQFVVSNAPLIVSGPTLSTMNPATRAAVLQTMTPTARAQVIVQTMAPTARAAIMQSTAPTARAATMQTMSPATQAAVMQSMAPSYTTSPPTMGAVGMSEEDYDYNSEYEYGDDE